MQLSIPEAARRELDVTWALIASPGQREAGIKRNRNTTTLPPLRTGGICPLPPWGSQAQDIPSPTQGPALAAGVTLQPGNTLPGPQWHSQPPCSAAASAPTSSRSPVLLQHLPYHITAAGVTIMITPFFPDTPFREERWTHISCCLGPQDQQKCPAQISSTPLLQQLRALTWRPYGLYFLTIHSCTSSTNLLLFPFLVLFTAHADPYHLL